MTQIQALTHHFCARFFKGFNALIGHRGLGLLVQVAFGLEYSAEEIFNPISSLCSSDNKDELKKEMLYFSQVDLIDLSTIQWTAIRFHRNNSSYRMLISLCQLIVEGMLLTTEKGEQRLASFFDEPHMCRLYEKFILEYYSTEHKELSVSAPQIPWALDDGVGTLLPVMQSDVILKKASKALIIDAKYYARTTQVHHDVHTIHSNNLYQIYSYVKNYDATFGDQPHIVSGMLLYAATDEEIQPNQAYMMQRNQISVRTLDLNQEFAAIAAQLDQIAAEHFS